MDIEAFLQHARNFHEELQQASDIVRVETGKVIDGNLNNGRELLIAVLRHLHVNHNSPPEVQSDSGNEGIILLVAFMQGVDYVRDLIFGGQYIKSCSALRQDYEILTRFGELRRGLARPGKMPNIKNAPEGSQRFYGHLSRIVHPSRPTLLLNFLEGWEDQLSSARVIHHLPYLIPGVAQHLYRIHVWTVLEITRESLLLFASLYGSELHDYRRSELEFNRAVWSLEAAGFEFTLAE